MQTTRRRLTSVPLAAAALALVLALAGCADAGGSSTSSASPTSATAAATSTEGTGSTVEANETSGAEAPTSSPPTWAITSVNSADDCAALAPFVIGATELEFRQFGSEHDGVLATAQNANVLDGSTGGCASGTSEGEFSSVHVGRTPDGAPIDASALATMWDWDLQDRALELPLVAEPYGAGTLYSAEGPRWAFCHYAEGSVLVSHQRPIDGECLATLRAVVDGIRS